MPVYQLTRELVFPSPRLAQRDGLLAVGGDLQPERLLLAYAHGIFPWYSEGDPILWWSPDPRLLLYPGEFHLSKSLRRVIKAGTFRVTLDMAFGAVVEGCADMRTEQRDGTWITSAMASAYRTLHELGYAHSVECWQGPELAGGLYGISLGRAFFGESMFSRSPNASKVALAALVEQANTWEFAFIDCQLPTEHLLGLGAREVRRDSFLDQLEGALQSETWVGRWPSSARPEILITSKTFPATEKRP